MRMLDLYPAGTRLQLGTVVFTALTERSFTGKRGSKLEGCAARRTLQPTTGAPMFEAAESERNN